MSASDAPPLKRARRSSPRPEAGATSALRTPVNTPGGSDSGPITSGLAVAVDPAADTTYSGESDVTTDMVRVRRWVGGRVTGRLVDNFLDFKHLARATFSLSRLPSMLSWGPKLNCADYSGVLCWWSTPLVVWAVGYLQSVKYYTGPDEPLPVTTVTLELMRDTDDRALHQFAAVWDIELSSRSTFEARWTSTGAAGLMASGIHEKSFDSAYDATASYTSKERMDRLPVSDFVVGDIVLVECKLIRNGGVEGYPSDATAVPASWFSLEAMSRLHCRPRAKMFQRAACLLAPTVARVNTHVRTGVG
ncbi:uncharacterized protein TRAVEDRAFT_25098 [Trametes versicolor FP-101664 SS1]|uniref:Uncharacterized protein n=1 Tax=Trametes versicolor (strain FP-101664) TaxID=717944 RepID=R7S6B9_TRAVS|nr:uncharacterized protein TRAVEDRAFT_25098 [Trametes versicolor FP-101664 SS1]EIW51391.1 hypothetical protein TRAVEDRAFT_25098 [Trametes versicolor FP-101664 SS1]